MKILLISPFVPYPLFFGGSVRIYHLARQLAKHHELSLLTMRLAEEGDPAGLADFCHEVVCVPRGKSLKRLDQLRSLFSSRSYQTASHCSEALQAALDTAVKRLHIELIVVEFSQMMGLRFPAGIPVVLDEHNVEYDLLERMSAEGCFLRRCYNRSEARKFRLEELAAVRRSALTLLTSGRDEALWRREVQQMHSAVFTNGVDTRYFARPQVPRKPHTAVFVGATHYFPNEDGLLFFIREVMDLVVEALPDFSFLVVGGRPSSGLRAAAAGRPVDVVGFVNDVRPFMWEASAFVVPLRMGGGTRFKVVEAMAAEVPVVSTSLGAEGLPVISGRDLILADRPADFAAGLVSVLRDQELAHALCASGLTLVREHLEWDLIGQKLDRAIAELHAP